MIASSSSPADVGSKLQQWSAPDDSEIATSLYQSVLQADLAGQLFVRLVEVPEAKSRKALATPNSRASFLSMPFAEALEFFRSKDLLTPAEFAALEAEARTQAFTATELASDHLRAFAQTKLSEHLDQGGTLADFARQLQSEEVSLGVTPSDSYYVENVFRTNVGGAYSAGRYRQITSPAVKSARPYVQYRNPDDSRTTQICSYLNGLIFRQDDPGWPRFAPLNHFQCRSSIVTLRSNQVDPSQVIRASQIPANIRPDPGFDSSPIG